MEPELNIEIGAWYLAWCGKRFPDRNRDGDISRLAIYNAGYGRVRDNWLPKDPKAAMTLQDIGFPSTRDYIKQIVERAHYYRERRDF